MCQAARVVRQTAGDADDTAAGDDAVEPAWARQHHRPPHRSRARSKVVLLGTGGGSNPKAVRSGIASAVVVDGEAYVVDCGEGVHPQLWRAGIAMHRSRVPEGGAAVRAIFITHLHSDHVIDLANLILGMWPAHEIDVFGPGPAGLPIPTYPPDRPPPELFHPEDPTPGTAAMVRSLLGSYAYNVNVRIADEGRADVTRNVRVREIGVTRKGYGPEIDLGVEADGRSLAAAAPPMAPVEIHPLDDRGVRVTAILVQHAPVFPALAYRFDTPGGSVVFSGDTGPCDNLVRLADGADILVHEVIDLDWMERRVQNLPNRDAVLSHLAGAHTPADQVGGIAQRAGVRTLVLSHLVPGDDEVSAAQWEERVRPHFDGEVICARELDELALQR